MFVGVQGWPHQLGQTVGLRIARPGAPAHLALLGPLAVVGVCRLVVFTGLLGRGPVFRVGFGFIVLSFRRFSERHGAELLSSRCCAVLFR